jgi:hypothetical protein
VAAIRANPKVALTIDTEASRRMCSWSGVASRWSSSTASPRTTLVASRKLVGEEGMPAFENQVRTLYDQMARIVLTPEWAKVLDFETRAPEFVHRLAAEKGLEPPS